MTTTQIRWGHLADAGSYNDEDAWNVDTDKYDLRKIKVECPGCRTRFAALCSSKTTKVADGMRWVGCDHKEPYATYVTTHRCGAQFSFTTYTPQ